MNRKGRNQVLSHCSSLKLLRAHKKLVTIAEAEKREITDRKGHKGLKG